MNGGVFGQNTGSAFGQPAQQQGSSLFGANSAAKPATGGLFGQQQPQQPAPATGGLFGAKRSNSFSMGSSTSQQPAFGQSGGSSLFGGPSTTSGTGLFGSGTSGTGSGNTGGSLFGQNNNQPSGGLFGSNASTGSTGFGQSTPQPQNQSGGLFGQSQQPQSQSGGLFGQTQQPQAQSGGLFGQKPATSLFGQSSTPNTGGGSLFGQKPATGGLFGQNQSQPQSQPQTGGLFGQNQGSSQPQQPQSGGLFGQQSSQPSGGLFGQSQQGTSLFGQSQPQTGGLFGSRPPQTGGLFGQSQPQSQAQQPQQSQGGLFGGTGTSTGTSTGGLFGKPTAPAPTSTSSMGFGFGQSTAPASGSGPQQAHPRLVATIDQSSYALPGAVPSQKLYSSLTPPISDRDRSDSLEAKKPIVAPPQQPQSRAPTTGTRHQEPRAALLPPPPSTAPETRQYMNSYNRFLAERPTTLVIRRGKPKALALEAPATGSAPLPAAESSIVGQPAHQDTVQQPQQPLPEPAALPDPADVSLFHRQANSVTLVRVNKRALDEGYFVRPSLEQLASLSRHELAAVPNLVIGREGFGQIEYPVPVDLTSIGNLGDILGTLVVFEPGTVCVYPDETRKAAPGRELNLSCTVTIEQAWPLDASTKEPVTNMADPRMERHIQRLRRACEARGGEFVTFARGVWVFKVPHFSTWGLPVDEMVLDEDGDVLGVENAANTSNSGASFMGDQEEADFDVRVVDEGNSVMPRGDMEASEGGDPVVPSEKRLRLEIVSPEPDVPMGDEAGDPGDPELTHVRTSWVAQLHHAAQGVLVASSNSIKAMSQPHIDLNEALFSHQQNGPISHGFTSRNAWIRPSGALSGVSVVYPRKPQLNYTWLLSKTEVRPRKSVPLLHTRLAFEELSHVGTPVTKSGIWSLGTILYGANPRENLAIWLANRVSRRVAADVAAAPSDFDAVWALVTGHRLGDAARHAVSTGNPHLAVQIALLGDPKGRADAAEQLRDWKQNQMLPHVPAGVRHIYELAASSRSAPQPPDWERRLGMALWYSDADLKSCLTSVSADSGPELALIRAAANPRTLADALALLKDPVEAFLYLQALPQPGSGSPSAPSALVDRVAHDLALGLVEGGDAEAAVVVALHIRDERLAQRVVRVCLSRQPRVSVPVELPAGLIDTARALHAHYVGDFWAEAGYLLAAKRNAEAHMVLVERVAPQCVLKGEPQAVHEILSKVDTSHVPTWPLGGQVYMDFMALHDGEDPDQVQVLTQRLCSALSRIPTPTLESRVAVSRMASYVAEVQKGFGMAQILGMRLSPSEYRIQALQQAASLLS